MLSRRRLLETGAALAALGAAGSVAADTYPTRPVTWIVPYPAGGSGDLIARVLAAHMSQSMGQQIIVQNRAGAGGALGTSQGIRSRPDGYTLTLSVVGPTVILPQISKDVDYSPLKDLTPIALINTGPLAVVVNDSVPARTMAELIAYARAKPGGGNYGSIGVGSMGHLACELLNLMAGLSMTHVPYQGAAPAMTAVLGNEIDMTMPPVQDAIPHAQAGRVRILAITSRQRISHLPEVPTVEESAGLAGYEAVPWNGVVGPAGLPAELVERLNREVLAGLRAPAVIAKFDELALVPRPGTPADFGAFIAAEHAKWGEVAKRLSLSVR